MIGHQPGVPLAQPGGEVRAQLVHDERLVGQRGRENALEQADLHVGDQYRQLRRAEPALRCEALGNLVRPGEELDPPVELSVTFEPANEPRVHFEQRHRLARGDAQRLRLQVVVAEHELGDLPGHLLQKQVALLHGQVSARHDLVQQHLDVHLVVRAVHAGGIVDRVGVHAPSMRRELVASELGEAEVAALADDAAPQLVAVHPHGVVGPVAGIGVRLPPRFHVGADSAVPQEIDGCLQHLRNELVRRERRSFDAERRARLGARRNRLRASGPDSASLGQR